MTQYRFISKSKMSFAVRHNGRDTYVNFSIPYSNVSRFITTDKTLAEKIRKHIWFREGRIKEETPVVLSPDIVPETPEEISDENTTNESWLKKELFNEQTTASDSTTTETADEQTTASDNTTTEPADEQTQQDEPQGIRPEDVTSLAEAKDYLKTYYAAPREAIASREKVAEFCTANNIVFPNFEL